MRWRRTASWAERHINLDGQPFRVADRPHLREPMDRIDDAIGGTVVLMMPPQRGKTLLAQLRLARNVAVEPRRALWYSKTQIDARSLSDAKLKPLLEGTRHVQSVSFNDPDKRGRGLLFRFHTGPIELLSADVQSHRNSRSGSEIYMDEAWQYDERCIAEIHRRGDGYGWNRRQIIPTTAPDAGHELDVLWESSSKHEWHVVCPTCSQAFIPKMDGMFQWDQLVGENGLYVVDQSAATVRLVTPCCQSELRWSPELRKRLNDESKGAGYKCTNPHHSPRVWGYRFNVFSTDDWRSVIAEWLRAINAKRNGDSSLVREFKIKLLCEAWNANAERKPTGEIEIGPYMLGEQWADEHKDEAGRPYRFLTVDVQRDHFWAVVRSWSKDGRSRLLAREKILTAHEIAALADRWGVMRGIWYEQRLPTGQWVQLCESRVFLDSGWSPGGLVPRICSEHGFHAFRSYKRNAFKHSDGVYRIFDEGRYLDPFSGTQRAEEAGKRVLQFYFVADAAKDRMEVLRSEKGADGWPLWTAAQDCGDEYKSQMQAEAKVRVYGSDGVTYKDQWKRLEKDNHYFDLETMQIVCASMAGLLGNADEVPESQV